MTPLTVEGAGDRNAIGPVCDHRSGNATFMLILFVHAKGGVAGIGPLFGVTPERTVVPWHVIILQSFFFGAVKGAGSVVAQK